MGAAALRNPRCCSKSRSPHAPTASRTTLAVNFAPPSAYFGSLVSPSGCSHQPQLAPAPPSTTEARILLDPSLVSYSRKHLASAHLVYHPTVDIPVFEAEDCTWSSDTSIQCRNCVFDTVAFIDSVRPVRLAHWQLPNLQNGGTVCSLDTSK